ncbi:hypothetical protein FJV76_02780 [Mesorhizobium sp. WSM4303]|uniref:hypothetical protein n=1 Tax=unclassified Mesorhizobium TaxID=325217 RepID=UPI00115ECE95|nr:MULTISPECIES: hypothetical protein [unclassified Mesorhizobium]TRC96795.1 hypothetical protein FJV77_12445 [Mesorhizobium sp. WSM4306]TRD08470.1 hypothetical protein FJV76_02780 [Mesorhizobium sp. WSM4303]
MSNRYATIIIDDDGHEIVSAIGLFEGIAPQARIGRVEPVAPGVLIGMIRGGPVDAIGGFGFPRGAHDGSAIGLARASLKAAPAENSHAPAADAAGRKTTRKPVKAKRRKSGKIKRARPAKQVAASKAEPAGIPDHG